MDVVIHLFPVTVKLTALIALTLPNATVMTFAILEMIAVMIFLKLDVLVSHTVCKFCTYMFISVCASKYHSIST